LSAQKRKEMFLVPAGGSLRDVLELIGHRIRLHPLESCYFIASGDVLLFIELHESCETGTLSGLLGVTERRFVRLLCGPQTVVSERWPILNGRCEFLGRPHIARLQANSINCGCIRKIDRGRRIFGISWGRYAAKDSRPARCSATALRPAQATLVERRLLDHALLLDGI
jgi:hypothetical protein